jgi:hypothetical protein
LEESFPRTYFSHVFSKACQYDAINEKVCTSLKYVSIKYAQEYFLNALLGQNDLVKVIKNGTRLALKLV